VHSQRKLDFSTEASLWIPDEEFEQMVAERGRRLKERDLLDAAEE
jgi:hypothetical protein